MSDEEFAVEVATQAGRGTYEFFMGIRVFDCWVHEQDIRRAVDRPGGLDSAGAAHVAGRFALSLPMVVGKKAGAQPGQSVALHVGDAPPGAPSALAVEVGDDARARPVPVPGSPTTEIRISFADWMRRCGGRCAPDDVEVEISGDDELGRRVLEGLAVTI
jgi:uncharacterized protein (TIGR03083 family)